MHAELLNLSLFAFAIVKVALNCGIGLGIVFVIFAERYPAAAGQIARSLLAACRFRQEVPRSTEGKPTSGNRVSRRRTAQRRLDDLTNTGAPWVRVEASQGSGDGQLALNTGIGPGILFLYALTEGERWLVEGKQIHRRNGLAAGTRSDFNSQFSDSIRADQGVRRERLSDRRCDRVGEGKDRGLQQSFSLSREFRNYHQVGRGSDVVAQAKNGSREAASRGHEQSLITSSGDGQLAHACSNLIPVNLSSRATSPSRKVRRKA